MLLVSLIIFITHISIKTCEILSIFMSMNLEGKSNYSFSFSNKKQNTKFQPVAEIPLMESPNVILERYIATL